MERTQEIGRKSGRWRWRPVPVVSLPAINQSQADNSGPMDYGSSVPAGNDTEKCKSTKASYSMNAQGVI